MEGSVPAGGAPAPTAAPADANPGSAASELETVSSTPEPEAPEVKHDPRFPPPKKEKAEAKAKPREPAKPKETKAAPKPEANGSDTQKEAADKVTATSGVDDELVTERVDGRDITKTRKEWRKLASKGLAAEKRFQAAAQMRKDADAVLRAAKEAPTRLLSEMGPDQLRGALTGLLHSRGPEREVFREVLAEAIADERKPEPQRRQEAAEREMQRVEQERARVAKERTRVRLGAIDRIRNEYENQAIIESMKEAGLPVTGEAAMHHADRIKSEMNRLWQQFENKRGFGEMPEQEFQAELRQMSASMNKRLRKAATHFVKQAKQRQDLMLSAGLEALDGPGLLERIGPEGLEKIKAHLAEQAKEKRAAKAAEALKTQGDTPPAPKKPKAPEYIDPEDWADQRRWGRR